MKPPTAYHLPPTTYHLPPTTYHLGSSLQQQHYHHSVKAQFDADPHIQATFESLLLSNYRCSLIDFYNAHCRNLWPYQQVTPNIFKTLALTTDYVKKLQFFSLFFFSFWCYYPHTSRDSATHLCRICLS